jgi:hypothetical protein
MEQLISQLREIEEKYAEFFSADDKELVDYITTGMFGRGIFLNTDLPIKILKEVREAFDALPASYAAPLQDGSTG